MMICSLRCVKSLGRENIKNDQRFRNNELRTRNQKVLFILLQKTFEGKTVNEWVSIFDAAGIPVALINTIDKLLDNPQLNARNMFLDIPHPVIGNMKITGTPINLEKTPGDISSPAPILGQHTEEILKNVLNIDDSTIAYWKKNGTL